jgi:hypothetical protein
MPAPLRQPSCYIRSSSIWVDDGHGIFWVKLLLSMTKCAQIWEHMFYAKGKQRQRHDIANIRLIQRGKQHSKNWERLNKHQRTPKGQSKMENPKKMAT